MIIRSVIPVLLYIHRYWLTELTLKMDGTMFFYNLNTLTGAEIGT